MRPPNFITNHDREESALREVGSTAVSHPVRIFLLGVFLLTLIAIPVLQHLAETRHPSGKAPRGSGALEILHAFPKAIRSALRSEDHGLIGQVGAFDTSLKEDFKNYERSLEEHSFLRKQALPRVQGFASRFLGLGNEKVFLGSDGWLFYRPDVDYLTGKGFLSASSGPRSEATHNDPLPALVRFKEDLASRGIHLLILPVPVKPMIEPEHLTFRHLPKDEQLQNKSYTTFLQRLGDGGIDCLDVTGTLRSVKSGGGKPAFLRTDTHWTPAAMEEAAHVLATRIHSLLGESGASASDPLFRSSAHRVRAMGDLTTMLQLPKGSSLYPPEVATIHPVLHADGTPWKADPNADILLLGDSFSRIYSAEDLYWGSGAGLPEHLSLRLQKPLDVIAINAGGASAARQQLARSPEHLDHKKLVIYEFAMRELSSGDWKVIPLPEVRETAPRPLPSVTSVTGTIAEITRSPAPGTTPYRDVVVAVHLTGTPEGDCLIFLRGMRDGVLTPTASLQSGEQMTFHVRPWSEVEDRYGTMNRIEPAGAAAELERIYWSDDYAGTP